MIIFLLVLILFAVLYSTEVGRELMEELLLLPFKVLAYPFKVTQRSKAEALKSKELKEIGLFKKNLKEDLHLIRENYILHAYFKEIIEQINFYKQFEKGEIDRAYLNPSAGIIQERLWLIKEERIEHLRKVAKN